MGIEEKNTSKSEQLRRRLWLPAFCPFLVVEAPTDPWTGHTEILFFKSLRRHLEQAATAIKRILHSPILAVLLAGAPESSEVYAIFRFRSSGAALEGTFLLDPTLAVWPNFFLPNGNYLFEPVDSVFAGFECASAPRARYSDYDACFP